MTVIAAQVTIVCGFQGTLAVDVRIGTKNRFHVGLTQEKSLINMFITHGKGHVPS